jgi:hypothetical protein
MTSFVCFSEADKLYIRDSSSQLSSINAPDLDRFPFFRSSRPFEAVLEVIFPQSFLSIHTLFFLSLTSFSPPP